MQSIVAICKLIWIVVVGTAFVVALPYNIYKYFNTPKQTAKKPVIVISYEER